MLGWQIDTGLTFEEGRRHMRLVVMLVFDCHKRKGSETQYLFFPIVFSFVSFFFTSFLSCPFFPHIKSSISKTSLSFSFFLFSPLFCLIDVFGAGGNDYCRGMANIQVYLFILYNAQYPRGKRIMHDVVYG